MEIRNRFEDKRWYGKNHVVNCKNDDEIDSKRRKVNNLRIYGMLMSMSKLKMNKRVGILCLGALFTFSIFHFFNFKSSHQTLHLDEGELHYQCQGLNFEEEIDELLSTHKQVFITMPAKAAGSAMKAFVEKCMKGDTEIIDNVLEKRENVRDLLTGPFEPPSIIVSHSFNSGILRRLAKHATRDSLIVYIHREETDRLLSGIRNVVADRMCPEKKENGTCVIEEEELVTKIGQRYMEIGMSVTEVLQCGTFKDIQDNAPNMVFMDYKQASQLQRLLAKHHCPELLENPVRLNVGMKKDNGLALVQLMNHSAKLPPSLHSYPGGIVSLTDWMNAKRNILELSLDLKMRVTCQSDVREMEDKLYACQDHTILFRRNRILHTTQGKKPLPFSLRR